MNNQIQRVNITLPSRTLRRIDRIADRGGRSRLIDEAVNFYIAKRSQAAIRRALREGAEVRAARDRVIAAELFDLNDIWERPAR